MTKILLIEDDKLTRITVGQFLRGEGFDVNEAEDGAQALSLLADDRFDLILSDIVMPKVNGFVIVEQAAAASPPTPVILMTAYAGIQSQTANSRPAGLILKPILLDDLLATIQSVLTQKN